MMQAKHEAGSQGKKGKAKDARDFDADYEGAKHKFEKTNDCGIPASAFRAAMISACRVAGFKMTLAKLSVHIEADGIDAVDGLPLVKIIGKPEKNMMHVRNATGVCDLRCRPMWREWSAKLTIRFDESQFSKNDVVNLLNRAGQQVGIGEGRPDSRSGIGLGWGTFHVETGETE